MVFRMRYHKPAAPLRKIFLYSNDNYALAGEFIAKLAGVPYTEFVKDNILDPLGMSETLFDHEVALASGKRVEGFLHYDYDEDQRRKAIERGEWNQACVGKVGQMNFWDSRDGNYIAAAGGLWSTGQDIVRLCPKSNQIKERAKSIKLAWLKETLEPSVIPQSVIDACSRPRMAMEESEPQPSSLSMHYYGMGQYTSYYRGHRIVCHAGGLPGHYSLVLRMPDDSIGCAIFINDENFGPQMMDVICMMLIDELLELQGRVDWEEVCLFKEMRKVRDLLPQGATRMDRNISGIYVHEAYATLVVQRIEDHPLGSTFTELLKESPGKSLAIHPDAQIYIGDLDHRLGGSLLLSSFDGEIFTRAFIEAKRIQPSDTGDERNFALQVLPYFLGKCVVTAEGIGMFEGFWGQGAAAGDLRMRKCVVENVKEEAEVWFRKVG